MNCCCNVALSWSNLNISSSFKRGLNVTDWKQRKVCLKPALKLAWLLQYVFPFGLFALLPHQLIYTEVTFVKNAPPALALVLLRERAREREENAIQNEPYFSARCNWVIKKCYKGDILIWMRSAWLRLEHWHPHSSLRPLLKNRFAGSCSEIDRQMACSEDEYMFTPQINCPGVYFI